VSWAAPVVALHLVSGAGQSFSTSKQSFRSETIGEPGQIDRLPAATQLLRMLLFNVSTFLAMQRGLDARRSNLRYAEAAERRSREAPASGPIEART